MCLFGVDKRCTEETWRSEKLCKFSLCSSQSFNFLLCCHVLNGDASDYGVTFKSATLPAVQIDYAVSFIATESASKHDSKLKKFCLVQAIVTLQIDFPHPEKHKKQLQQMGEQNMNEKCFSIWIRERKWTECYEAPRACFNQKCWRPNKERKAFSEWFNSSWQLSCAINVRKCLINWAWAWISAAEVGANISTIGVFVFLAI